MYHLTETEKKNRANFQLMNYIEHHRHQVLGTVHTHPPLPVLRRCVNLPYRILVIIHMQRVMKAMRKNPPSFWVLTFALMSLRKEYSIPPPLKSLKHVKHLFYQWLLHKWLLMHPTEYSKANHDFLQSTIDTVEQELIEIIHLSNL